MNIKAGALLDSLKTSLIGIVPFAVLLILDQKYPKAAPILNEIYLKSGDVAPITASFAFTFMGLVGVSLSLLASYSHHPVFKTHYKKGNIGSHVSMIIASVGWLAVTFIASIAMFFSDKMILFVMPCLLINADYIRRSFTAVWNLIKQSQTLDEFGKEF